MDLDGLEGSLRKKGAAELITETGTGTATLNALVDTVTVSDSTVFSQLLGGVEHEVFTVSHKPTEHGIGKRYVLTILGRRVYDWVAQTEFEQKIRKLCRVQHERGTVFGRMVEKFNWDMKICKMVTDSELVRD